MLTPSQVNIGNARLFGLEEDLGMDPKGPKFQIAVSTLFITYCVSLSVNASEYRMLI